MPHARALAVHRYLFRLALAVGSVFGWIVVFQVFFVFSGDIATALAGTALLYACAQGISIVLTPLAGSALRHGVQRALIIGSVVLAFSFGLLAALFVSDIAFFGDTAFWLAAGFAVCSGIARAIYFVPYSAAASQLHSASSHVTLREATLACAPFVGALCIIWIGVGTVFAVAAALALAAACAVVQMPALYERFDWTYSETFAQLFSLQNRQALGGAVFDGIQGAVLLLIWTLAVYLMFSSSFVLFGAVMTTTLLLVLAFRILTRRMWGVEIRQSRYVLAAVAFTSWIVRVPVGIPVQIILADFFYNSVGNPHRRGIDMYAGVQSADNAHYVDEYSALKEMGQCIGGIIACALFAGLVLVFTPIVAFIACIAAAAVAAAASVLLSYSLKKEAF